MLAQRATLAFRVLNLNYNHLHYFWAVATRGSIARAARSLHVTPQTISGQIRTLEDRLGSALFERVGRKLALTETGKIVHAYADAMFSLSLELGEALERHAPRRPGPLTVGVATELEKAIVCRLLRPAMDASISTRILCHEARAEVLVSALLAREIDLAVTNAAAPSGDSGGVRSHLIGQTTMTFFGPAPLAERYRAQFPRSLTGAPVVMPARGSVAAKALAAWFRREQIAPRIVAEVDSPDLASAVCESYGALLALPTIAADDVERRYRMTAAGEASRVHEQLYIIGADSARRPDSILAVVEGAREEFRAALIRNGAAPPAADAWRESWALPRSA